MLSKTELLAMYGQAVRVACFETVEKKPTSPIISVLLIKKRLKKNPQILDASGRDVIHWLRVFGVPVESNAEDRSRSRRPDLGRNYVLRGQRFNQVISSETLTVTVNGDVIDVPGITLNAFGKRVVENDDDDVDLGPPVPPSRRHLPDPSAPRRTLFPKKAAPAIIRISMSDLAAALKIAARDRVPHTWISLDRVRQVLLATYPTLAAKTLGHDLRQRRCRLKVIQGYTVIVWNREIDALMRVANQ